MTRRATRTLQNLALTLSALTFTVLLCELLVRTFAPQHPSWLPIYRAHPAADVYAVQANLDTTIEAGDGAYRVKTDASGWRVSTNARDDARPVMLVVGDSYAFGQGVAYEASFVGMLDANPRVALHPVNLGVGGYGPRDYRRILEYALALADSPRFVLVAIYTGNDFTDVLLDKSALVRDGILGNPRTPRAWLKRSSHLYRLASNAYHRFAPTKDAYRAAAVTSPSQWEREMMKRARTAFAAELAAIKSLCLGHDVPLGVVLIPTKRAVEAERGEFPPPQSDSPASDESLPTRHALAICNEIELHCLDLTAPLAEHATAETYLRVDGHFSPLGGRIAAQAIASEFPELTLPAAPEGERGDRRI